MDTIMLANVKLLVNIVGAILVCAGYSAFAVDSFIEAVSFLTTAKIYAHGTITRYFYYMFVILVQVHVKLFFQTNIFYHERENTSIDLILHMTFALLFMPSTTNHIGHIVCAAVMNNRITEAVIDAAQWKANTIIGKYFGFNITRALIEVNMYAALFAAVKGFFAYYLLAHDPKTLRRYTIQPPVVEVATLYDWKFYATRWAIMMRNQQSTSYGLSRICAIVSIRAISPIFLVTMVGFYPERYFAALVLILLECHGLCVFVLIELIPDDYFCATLALAKTFAGNLRVRSAAGTIWVPFVVYAIINMSAKLFFGEHTHVIAIVVLTMVSNNKAPLIAFSACGFWGVPTLWRATEIAYLLFTCLLTKKCFKRKIIEHYSPKLCAVTTPAVADYVIVDEPTDGFLLL